MPGMRELWIFNGGGVLGVPSRASYVPKPEKREKFCTKLTKTRKKLAHSGTTNRSVWGGGRGRVDRNQILQGLTNCVTEFGAEK